MVDPFQIINNTAQPIEAATPTSPLPLPCSDPTTALKQEEEEKNGEVSDSQK